MKRAGGFCRLREQLEHRLCAGWDHGSQQREKGALLWLEHQEKGGGAGSGAIPRSLVNLV